MLTFSSQSLSPTLVEAFCSAMGATSQPVREKEKPDHPAFTLTFPKTKKGAIPSIKVKATSSLDDISVSLLTFYLTLSALDVFPLLQCMIVLIRARRRLTKAQEENIISATHEALLNALIHGNLGANSDYNDAYKMFDHFEAIGEMLLENKQPKTITLQMEFPVEGIVISVTDQGNGFSEHAIVPPGENALHGRGMAIIRECCDTVDITDGGRTIIMRFASTTMPPPNTSPYIAQAHILVVEDVAVNRAIIHEILRRKGFSNISIAIDGVEAYQKTLDLKPDLVLLDLMLPKMDGYEYCRRVRQHPGFKDLPIVIQTALSQEAQRSKAFACGASDLVTKPINAYELVARITLHLERHELLQSLKNYRQRMQRDLESARKMQDSILPSKTVLSELNARYGMNIHSLFQTSSEIGGDIWGIRLISDTDFAIYIADFSGHGITSALNAFRLQAILQAMLVDMHNPSAVLEKANNKLCALLETGQFATMFYAVIDTKKNRLSYAAAGSTNPALLRGGKKIKWLDGTGLPLGINEGRLYPTYSIPYAAEDMLFFYSDALIETQNSKGEFVTTELLESILPSKNPQLSFENVLQKFKVHCDKGVEDDLTIILCSKQPKK